MKKTFILILIVVILFCSLSGCTADIMGNKMANQIQKYDSTSNSHTARQDTSPGSPEPTNSSSFPIVFYHSHAGDGSIRVAVNQAQIVRKLDDLPLPDGFIEDLAYAYGGATKDPTLYEYPDIFCADGSMREGIYMVLLDVTVANPDSATSRYQNENGKWCDHYENPYLFQAQSICHLINRSASTDKQMYLSYFSEKSDKWKNPDSFLLEGGDEKNFQLGFLVGYDTFVENNQFIGKPVSPEDILLWTLLPEFSSATWELNLH